MKLAKGLTSGVASLAIATATLFGAANLAQADMYKDSSILDLAEKEGGFTMFLKAVDAAGLGETLETSDDITVFLPSDAAFEALPEETLTELLSPQGKDKLTDILSYHVVTKELEAVDITTELEQSETLPGEPVAFTVDGSSKMVNEASVVSADLSTKNGVVHVIDKVLIPNDS